MDVLMEEVLNNAIKECSEMIDYHKKQVDLHENQIEVLKAGLVRDLANCEKSIEFGKNSVEIYEHKRKKLNDLLLNVEIKNV